MQYKITCCFTSKVTCMANMSAMHVTAPRCWVQFLKVTFLFLLAICLNTIFVPIMSIGQYCAQTLVKMKNGDDAYLKVAISMAILSVLFLCLSCTCNVNTAGSCLRTDSTIQGIKNKRQKKKNDTQEN